jgi:putative protease
MRNKSTKPELLLPAGNTEAFFAAAEGGADAVYLGLQQFNARERADNFTYQQLLALLDEAEKRQMKVYLTLNTVIKNKELPELLDTLHALSQTSISAVIIQDWGVYNLIKQHFPKLKIHGSTQMGNHNSLGAIYSEKRGFERVIFARELTEQELTAITSKSDLEVEMFIHGALCYSFSGMCLFSSYLGGMSANRGMCMQPCRRMFTDINQKRYIFSLKDNQLIDHIPEIKQMAIASLKVEGRLKPAEYVYQVAKAYRKAIDSPEQLKKAKNMLSDDLGREKTSYFFGKDVKRAITENPTTGKYLGKISSLNERAFFLHTSEELQQGNRLWIRSPKGVNRSAVKIKSIKTHPDNQIEVHANVKDLKAGDQVYLANFRQKKFTTQLPERKKTISTSLPEKKKQKILDSFGKEKKLDKTQIFLRIDSIKWLKKVPLQEIDNLILNLPEKEWRELDVETFLMKKNAHKIIFELPKFIPEEKITFYKDLFSKFRKSGYKSFMISHLSQKMIIPEDSIIVANENVYTFNDSAIDFLQQENIKLFCYPLENEMDNLFSLKNKKGIVPVYFYPELFYSRMPVKVNDKFQQFSDDKNYEFQKIIKNGLTIVIPKNPVSLTQYKTKLEAKGFGRYLVDVSYEKPSDKRLNTMIKKLKASEQIQPSITFNFKKGLT